jgi:putative hydrolase of the HAD superfamily
MIKAVLFDADGVIVNPSFQFAKLLAEQYGITRQMTSGFFQGIFDECTQGRADLKQVLAPYLPEWGWQGTVDDFVSLWLKTDHVVDMRVVEAIAKLRQHGLLCCLATIQEANRAAYMRTYMGFEQVFDRLFFSYELGCQKPDPAYFHAIQNALQIEPQELLFWDDYQKNVDAARQCGWNAELYTTFEAFEERMRAWISW